MLSSNLVSALILCAGAFTAQAKVVPRSQPSPGGQCYFQCPDVDRAGTASLTVSGQTASCQYQTRNGPVTCNYDVSSGQLTNPNDDAGFLNVGYYCQDIIETSKCSSTAQGNPDSATYFKRDLTRLGESPAERRLRALQYQPSKSKARRVLEIKQKLAKRAL